MRRDYDDDTNPSILGAVRRLAREKRSMDGIAATPTIAAVAIGLNSPREKSVDHVQPMHSEGQRRATMEQIIHGLQARVTGAGVEPHPWHEAVTALKNAYGRAEQLTDPNYHFGKNINGG